VPISYKLTMAGNSVDRDNDDAPRAQRKELLSEAAAFREAARRLKQHEPEEHPGESAEPAEADQSAGTLLRGVGDDRGRRPS
jgi:hypothetical protein